MVEQAHENGLLFDELLYLVIEMSSANSLREMLFSLNRWAKNWVYQARQYVCLVTVGGYPPH